MRSAQEIVDRSRALRARNAARDRDYMKLIAIRKGDYESVAPGLFPNTEFDRPLVANLVDTTARDIAEVMAPLPMINCDSASLSSEADQKRQDLRAAIANSYLQNSRLQDQMFSGCDRYGSFGFLAYIAEPDFKEHGPVIRISDIPTADYTRDFRGRTVEYYECFRAPLEHIRANFPNAAGHLNAKYGLYKPGVELEVIRHYDDHATSMVLVEQNIMLEQVSNRIGRCPVRIVERPSVTGETRGQFDDVIWVQIARAVVQMYTMNALEQSVNAPIAIPKDVQDFEIGPFTMIQTDSPGSIGRVNLQLSPGLFPEQQMLAQEQRVGSRYPEGRSGSIDASIITGQGVQALMGTFDTQVQTFQRLNSSALEDLTEICYRMDEAYWGGESKTRYIKDNGAPRKITYTPNKDIAGNYTVDVTYGAIAGLDPNRGLVFVLQALAGGLIAKSTARKSLPVDLNQRAEELQIQKEQIEDAVAATLAMLPQAIPQMAAMGQDPREVVMQVTAVHKLITKGKSVVEAMDEVFAPPEKEQPQADPMQDAMQQAAAGDPSALPGQGSGGASDLLMSLAGMTPGGQANLQSNVSRMKPI